MTCINCGTQGDGKFCSNCAQPLQIKRITFKEAWHDFWARIYGFDGMFPRTFKDLSVRPGFAARQFIEGNRARYYGPVGYYFLMITCFLLWHTIIGLDYTDYMKAAQQSIMDDGNAKFNAAIRAFIYEYLKVFGFVVVPFIVFASRYIFFRKQGLNFMEHSVPVFYIMGHWYWFMILTSTLFRFTNFNPGAFVQQGLLSLYMGFGYTSFVTTQSKGKVFAKGVGVYVLGFMLFMLIAMIIAFPVIYILLETNPDLLKDFRPSQQNP